MDARVEPAHDESIIVAALRMRLHLIGRMIAGLVPAMSFRRTGYREFAAR
jgi:hypothetical protein